MINSHFYWHIGMFTLAIVFGMWAAAGRMSDSWSSAWSSTVIYAIAIVMALLGMILR